MNKWLLMACTAAIAAAGSWFVLQSDFNPFESAMIKSCEMVLKKRLLAPTGYRRIEVTEMSDPLSLQEYLQERHLTTDDERVIFTRMYNDGAAGKNQPTKFTQIITYDAPNAYGTPVRGMSQYRSIDASKASAAWYSVIVDNFTETGWLADQVLKSKAPN
ncbi:hypothetical protein FJW08_03515 [Mesorhizobium sp. B3-2-1]|uniref:hypothetical protein n=1 Tax=Mesorhizobium sp. B3-2-1 TaxID=2589891 RepID=UPI00112AF23F|nr:hypothetical protein [Mesorhizobium sp. B3-2-1]TPI34654.1 hypothetical protein FJW08_03515 [Mesorhizobium sp. B3-2-1]